MTTRSLILLVEDNPDDEELTLLAFEQGGITNPIRVAHDGVEALDYLLATGTYVDRSTQELPTLILLDLQLPRINGLEVLQRIRSNPQIGLIPVVILTTSNEQQDLIESYSLGCNSYIRKPVDYDQFLKAIQQLGMYWLITNTPPPLLLIQDDDTQSACS
jgi:CheY-like chemotaxis protein